MLLLLHKVQQLQQYMTNFSSGGSEEMHASHKPTWRERWFGTRVLFILSTIVALQIPILLMVERFLQPDKRAALWRLFGHRNCVLFVKLAKIELNVREMPEYSKADGPLIFASTHPSMIDGLLMYSLLGPDTITLVAPFSSISWPGNYFFKKMGFIDIQRDIDDRIKHPTANTRKEAFAKIFEALDSGLNLLIFPEGHVEREHTLHYIHTGVSRISIRAKVPVQISTIGGVDKLLLTKRGFRPGKVTIRFGKSITPPAVSHQVPFRKVVKYHTKDIERALVNILPVRYLPDFYNVQPDSIAAFFDINYTVYDGHVMEAFALFLRKRKLISQRVWLKVSSWLFLERINVLNHRQLMAKSASIITGFDVSTFKDICQDFFDAEIAPSINHGILPTLQDHIKQGHHVILVSEVIHPLASLFAKHLKATASIDTTLLKDSNGDYSGQVDVFNYGYTKAERVEDFAKRFQIDLSKSYAYTDSYRDLPLLYAVRHKVVVNPDKKLQKMANAYSWPTL